MDLLQNGVVRKDVLPVQVAHQGDAFGDNFVNRGFIRPKWSDFAGSPDHGGVIKQIDSHFENRFGSNRGNFARWGDR
ncbi:TPA: hypothetical protein ACNU2I_004301, partial [Aeromonas salmonicida subsp. salmonicida]